MDIQFIRKAAVSIYKKMEENRDYLIRLDQQNGDGDLGLSMCGGFEALKDFFAATQEADLGKLFMQAARTFNEAAPSSLGTILSFGMMGMAKALKGKSEATPKELADALCAGVNNIMEKAKSRPGEKTILDALIPGVEALRLGADQDLAVACREAAKASAKGSESTRNMKSVHGRAAYYGEKSIGILDGGSVVGKLIFEGIADSV